MMKQHKKHKRRRRNRRRTLALVAVPAVVGASLVGGFAAAVLTMSGTVQADGKVATPTSPTASARIATLWPGECSDVSVTFSNDNDRPVVIDGVDGTITQQPGGGGGGRAGDDGLGDGPAVWRGAGDALANRRIPARGSASFTIRDAVCLSSQVTVTVQGEDVAASVTFGFHVPAGTEYRG
jgi:hypothetical protein